MIYNRFIVIPHVYLRSFFPLLLRQQEILAVLQKNYWCFKRYFPREYIILNDAGTRPFYDDITSKHLNLRPSSLFLLVFDVMCVSYKILISFYSAEEKILSWFFETVVWQTINTFWKKRRERTLISRERYTYTTYLYDLERLWFSLSLYTYCTTQQIFLKWWLSIGKGGLRHSWCLRIRKLDLLHVQTSKKTLKSSLFCEQLKQNWTPDQQMVAHSAFCVVASGC